MLQARTVASRTVTVSLSGAAAVLYCPVRIAEIVALVTEPLTRNHAALESELSCLERKQPPSRAVEWPFPLSKR